MPACMAFEGAFEEAIDTGAEFIDPAHVLLGALRQADLPDHQLAPCLADLHAVLRFGLAAERATDVHVAPGRCVPSGQAQHLSHASTALPRQSKQGGHLELCSTLSTLMTSSSLDVTNGPLTYACMRLDGGDELLQRIQSWAAQLPASGAPTAALPAPASMLAAAAGCMTTLLHVTHLLVGFQQLGVPPDPATCAAAFALLSTHDARAQAAKLSRDEVVQLLEASCVLPVPSTSTSNNPTSTNTSTNTSSITEDQQQGFQCMFRACLKQLWPAADSAASKVLWEGASVTWRQASAVIQALHHWKPLLPAKLTATPCSFKPQEQAAELTVSKGGLSMSSFTRRPAPTAASPVPPPLPSPPAATPPPPAAHPFLWIAHDLQQGNTLWSHVAAAAKQGVDASKVVACVQGLKALGAKDMPARYLTVARHIATSARAVADKANALHHILRLAVPIPLDQRAGWVELLTARTAALSCVKPVIEVLDPGLLLEILAVEDGFRTWMMLFSHLTAAHLPKLLAFLAETAPHSPATSHPFLDPHLQHVLTDQLLAALPDQTLAGAAGLLGHADRLHLFSEQHAPALCAAIQHVLVSRAGVVAAAQPSPSPLPSLPAAAAPSIAAASSWNDDTFSCSEEGEDVDAVEAAAAAVGAAVGAGAGADSTVSSGSSASAPPPSISTPCTPDDLPHYITLVTQLNTWSQIMRCMPHLPTPPLPHASTGEAGGTSGAVAAAAMAVAGPASADTRARAAADAGAAGAATATGVGVQVAGLPEAAAAAGAGIDAVAVVSLRPPAAAALDHAGGSAHGLKGLKGVLLPGAVPTSTSPPSSTAGATDAGRRSETPGGGGGVAVAGSGPAAPSPVAPAVASPVRSAPAQDPSISSYLSVSLCQVHALLSGVEGSKVLAGLPPTCLPPALDLLLSQLMESTQEEAVGATGTTAAPGAGAASSPVATPRMLGLRLPPRRNVLASKVWSKVMSHLMSIRLVERVGLLMKAVAIDAGGGGGSVMAPLEALTYLALSASPCKALRDDCLPACLAAATALLARMHARAPEQHVMTSPHTSLNDITTNNNSTSYLPSLLPTGADTSAPPQPVAFTWPPAPPSALPLPPVLITWLRRVRLELVAHLWTVTNKAAGSPAEILRLSRPALRSLAALPALSQQRLCLGSIPGVLFRVMGAAGGQQLPGDGAAGLLTLMWVLSACWGPELYDTHPELPPYQLQQLKAVLTTAVKRPPSFALLKLAAAAGEFKQAATACVVAGLLDQLAHVTSDVLWQVGLSPDSVQALTSEELMPLAGLLLQLAGRAAPAGLLLVLSEVYARVADGRVVLSGSAPSSPSVLASGTPCNALPSDECAAAPPPPPPPLAATAAAAGVVQPVSSGGYVMGSDDDDDDDGVGGGGDDDDDDDDDDDGVGGDDDDDDDDVGGDDGDDGSQLSPEHQQQQDQQQEQELVTEQLVRQGAALAQVEADDADDDADDDEEQEEEDGDGGISGSMTADSYCMLDHGFLGSDDAPEEEEGEEELGEQLEEEEEEEQ